MLVERTQHLYNTNHNDISQSIEIINGGTDASLLFCLNAHSQTKGIDRSGFNAAKVTLHNIT